MRNNSIELLRKQRKLSQESLGAAVGKDFRTISGYERNGNIPEDIQRSLASHLGCTVEELMRQPVIYPNTASETLILKDELTPKWIEFVDWLTEEVPMETLKRKAEAAFDMQQDEFEDWTKILMRRRRDRAQPESRNQPPE